MREIKDKTLIILFRNSSTVPLIFSDFFFDYKRYGEKRIRDFPRRLFPEESFRKPSKDSRPSSELEVYRYLFSYRAHSAAEPQPKHPPQRVQG
jgi:hypothetical protein